MKYYLKIQDKLGGGFQRFQSFSGQVTEMNVWDYVIDDGAVKNMAECRGDFRRVLLFGYSWFVTFVASLLCQRRID